MTICHRENWRCKMITSLFDFLSQYQVIIPIVQRDYAQGREVGQVPRIRERFVKVLFDALEDNNSQLELDFIYGYVKEEKYFLPLDGQQRLTTLFLLHWYVALKEGYLEDVNRVLSNFSYETRHSSKVFCECLVNFIPDKIDKPIKEVITNQPWFFPSWEYDPTINSMLVMLNAIQEKYNNRDISNAWHLLTSEKPRIVFHLLPMDKIGLPDDLYIKMNSRGKELTEFEYFKSQFVDVLSPEHLTEFKDKIDQDWSDLFWNLFKNKSMDDIARHVDKCFLRFFRYITDMLYFRFGQEENFYTDDINDYIKFYKCKENVNFLFSCLDALYEEYDRDPNFFAKLFYIDETDFDIGKTRLFFQSPSVDLVNKCSEYYDPSHRINPFSIGEQLLLYAVLEFLINKRTGINHKIRLLRNLISNSEDTVRKENMTSLLNEVERNIHDEAIDEDSKFNKRQVDEEKHKQVFLKDNSGLKDIVYKLEDHHLLQGCLAIFDLNDDIKDKAESFINVFRKGCDYDLISTSLFSLGDYSQLYGWRWRMGNKYDSTWRELFTPSQRRSGFQNTKAVLHKLLLKQTDDPNLKLNDLIDELMESYVNTKGKPKDFWYYFIKYPEFRKNQDGYYYWEDRDKQFECIMMNRKTLGGKHWSPFLYALKEISEKHLDLGQYGAPLVFVRDNVACKLRNLNEGYLIEAYEDDKDSIDLSYYIQKQLDFNEQGVFEIKQNDEHLDLDDRVEKGLELITSIFNL